MMPITSKTRVYGSFSENPGNNGCIFFNREFSLAGMDAIYKSFKITNIEKAVEAARTLDMGGFAVSMPFKQEVHKYLDGWGDNSHSIRAINTVVNDGGLLLGHNTDWLGFWNACSPLFSDINEPAIILGTGGFSVAIQYSLTKNKIPFEVFKREDIPRLTSLSNRLVFNATPAEILFGDNFFIDCRPDASWGIAIAKEQAKLQLELYRGAYDFS